uniref:Uncharacterized protein n=1 Tax=Romanomermis culicivorax TaxID=13658 RepID=A0A915IDE0_ROMCU
MANSMGKFPDFEHHITLTDDGIIIAPPVRQVPIARHASVEKEVEQMVTDDIWEGVTRSSAWALNLFTVPNHPQSNSKVEVFNCCI